MKSLLFILLAGYAVRSDENNYYVIEMQQVPPNPTNLQDDPRKPFQVYWNVPTTQCTSKKIYFENLFEDYGIIQNEKDRFKGEKVVILYDPGLFPALFKNESGGKLRFRNGGVPQEGDLSKHLDEFKKELDRSIPDIGFSGVGIIDFESWRPTFRQNFGVLQPYKDVSIEIERKLHWWWKKQWIEEQAKRRFEEAARNFMEGTLSVAKNLRPRARWGFYGFPYCFNMASNNMQETCAGHVPQENDEISWLWSGSTALYPSVYSSVQLSTSQLVSLIRGRVREAARCSQGNADDILPYFWFRYRDAGFLTESDLSMALSTLYNSRATGIIIWGSSNDVNTVEKCNKLLKYVQNTLGPAVAKYTKPIMRDKEEIEISTTLSADAVTETHSIYEIADPEFYWPPPLNLTTDFKTDVGEEINKKPNLNINDDTVLQSNNMLINLILKAVLSSNNESIISTEPPKTKYDKKNQHEKELIDITELNVKLTTTSQITNIAVTKNQFHNETTDTNIQNESQTVETTYKNNLITDIPVTEITVLRTEKIDETNGNSQINDYLIKGTVTNKTNINNTTHNDYDAIEDIEEDSFSDNDNFIEFYKDTKSDYVEDHTTDATNTDFTKNEKKELVNVNIISKNTPTINITTDLLTTSKNDLLETSSEEFLEPDSSTETNNKVFMENHDLTTESNTITIDSTKYTVPLTDGSKVKTVTEKVTVFLKSYDFDSKSSISTTNTNSQESVTRYAPDEARQYMDITTEGSEISKTTEYEATEGTSTSLSSILPTTEQVVVY